MEITSFDIHKLMVRAYQDSNVTTSFVDMVYDYFLNTFGINKIKYDDNGKYIEVTTAKKADVIKVMNDLRQLYASFVVNVIRTVELEFLLSKDSKFEEIKKLDDSQIFYMASPTMTILNITPPQNNDNNVFRLNLIN